MLSTFYPTISGIIISTILRSNNKKAKIRDVLNGCFGIDYRVTTLSTRYRTAKRIIPESFIR